MNRYERELEQAGYDQWRTREYGYSRMKQDVIGICPCCNKEVRENQLYVEADDVYHFSCYNEMKAEEEECEEE